MTWPLRARLTAWYTVVLVIVLVSGGAGVWWLQWQIGVAHIDGELADIHATIRRILDNELREQAAVREAASEAAETVADQSLFVTISDLSGHVLASHLVGADTELLRSNLREGASTTRLPSGTAWRFRTSIESVKGMTFRVVLGRPLADVERGGRSLVQAMLVGIPVVLVLAAAGGWWLASIALSPITEMAHRAARLPLGGTEDLGDSGRTDELGQLTRAFNGLVERLRVALTTQRRFMADASHELRTPVSIIRAASDVALSRTHRDEDEYRETLAIVNGQSSRIGQLVADMLVLAQADSGAYPVRMVNLDFSEIVGECRRAVKVQAAQHEVEIQNVDGAELRLHGDEELLRRLVLNLLRNAIEHSRPRGAITIGLEHNDATVTLRVTDNGPGIPESDRERIFQRFVRLDEARVGTGTGLGLPIARWIAEVHGGAVDLESSSVAGSTLRATLKRFRSS